MQSLRQIRAGRFNDLKRDRYKNKNAPPGLAGRGVFASGDLQAGQNHELVAPVLRAALLIVAGGARRPFFTVTHDLNSRRIDAAVRQIAVDNRGATLTQCHVVLV